MYYIDYLTPNNVRTLYLTVNNTNRYAKESNGNLALDA